MNIFGFGKKTEVTQVEIKSAEASDAVAPTNTATTATSTPTTATATPTPSEQSGQMSPSNSQAQFIAIGDMVVDAFIRLDEKSRAHTAELPDGSKEITLPFGDKIPFAFADVIAAVGNSANAAVSAARLGMSSALVVNIGNDQDGEKCLEQLVKEGISTAFVKKHDGKKTNYHYVLWFKDERTILIKHEEFNYTLPEIGNPKCIYLSSLSENALGFHDTIANYLDSAENTKLVFQPGTFQMKWGTDALTRIYKHTHLFFCNYEEAERILKIEPQQKSSEMIRTLLGKLRELGPSLPVITDGPNGAYTYSCTGAGVNGEINYNEIIHIPVYPDIAPPYERTGAGDAFASTFAVLYMNGGSVVDALKSASINSMNVCQHVGAQAGLLSKEKIAEYIANAPAGWGVKVI